MTIILTVLKTGQWHNGHFPCDYRPQHVQWLAEQFKVHAPNVRFACLSNVDIDGVEVIKLKYNWPGWWSKMELFREDFGKVFYVDLDTVIVSDLTALLNYDHKFTTWAQPRKVHHLQSGIMAWTGFRADIFDVFVKDPEYWMEKCACPECWGDQGFIAKHLKTDWDEFNQLFPKTIQSYKLDLNRKEPTSDVKIVTFHGKPKPWDVYKDHKFIPSFAKYEI